VLRARDPSKFQELQNAFDDEARALLSVGNLNHDHLIRVIAAFTRGDLHHFMFVWADGGSLRDFWENTPLPGVDTLLMPALVKETLQQIAGLADGLFKLHTVANFRHGDLKPENILRFNDETRLGNLKIADFGLSKQHKEMTERRRNPTSMKHATVRYESPDAKRSIVLQKEAYSRLSDIWSMGCILLEHLIWLLYGCKELERLNAEMQLNTMDTAAFWHFNTTNGKNEVLPVVASWMRHLASDRECTDTMCLSALLRLIRERLLVAEKPASWLIGPALPEGTVIPQRMRATTKEFQDATQDILRMAGRESTLFTGTPRVGIKGPPTVAEPGRPQRRVDPGTPVDPEDRLTPNAAFSRPIRREARPPMPPMGPPPIDVVSKLVIMCIFVSRNLVLKTLYD
jgi:serine/threonine protein kinase